MVAGMSPDVVGGKLNKPLMDSKQFQRRFMTVSETLWVIYCLVGFSNRGHGSALRLLGGDQQNMPLLARGKKLHWYADSYYWNNSTITDWHCYSSESIEVAVATVSIWKQFRYLQRTRHKFQMGRSTRKCRQTKSKSGWKLCRIIQGEREREISNTCSHLQQRSHHWRLRSSCTGGAYYFPCFPRFPRFSFRRLERAFAVRALVRCFPKSNWGWVNGIRGRGEEAGGLDQSRWRGIIWTPRAIFCSDEFDTSMDRINGAPETETFFLFIFK